MVKSGAFIIIALIFLLLVVGCAQPPTETPTPGPTETPTPTETLTSTPTPAEKPPPAEETEPAPTPTPVPISASELPATGDWVITGEKILENEAVTLNGNLIVENGGSLTLRNVELTMNCSYRGEYGIFSRPGSSLSIYDSVIVPSDEKITFGFRVDGVRLVLKNNEIRGVGRLQDMAPTEMREEDGSPMEGIIIESVDEAIIEGNTIYHKESSGLQLGGCQGALIRGNVIDFQGWGEGRSGISLSNSHNNEISENHLQNQIHAIGIYSSWNNLVANNEVTLKSHSTGIVVSNGSGNNVIANNSISKAPTAEWC